MKKIEFIKAIALKSGFSQGETLKMFNAMQEVILEQLTQEEPVKFPKLGAFLVKERAARMYFNPHEKKMVRIEATKVIRFKTYSSLKLKA